jgi:hypothetical protein
MRRICGDLVGADSSWRDRTLNGRNRVDSECWTLRGLGLQLILRATGTSGRKPPPGTDEKNCKWPT